MYVYVLLKKRSVLNINACGARGFDSLDATLAWLQPQNKSARTEKRGESGNAKFRLER